MRRGSKVHFNLNKIKFCPLSFFVEDATDLQNNGLPNSKFTYQLQHSYNYCWNYLQERKTLELQSLKNHIIELIWSSWNINWTDLLQSQNKVCMT